MASSFSKKKKNVFADDDNESSDFNQIRINQGFANRFQENKRREELTNLKRRYSQNTEEFDESSSEEEDEDAELLTPDIEDNFLKLLPALKQKKSDIYYSSKSFFSEPKEDEKVEDQPKEKKTKPLYLRDYLRQQLLENNGEPLESSDSERDEDTSRSKGVTHVQEQKLLKDEFLKSIKNFEDQDDGDDIFSLRTKTKAELQKENEGMDEFKKELERKKKEKELKKLPLIDGMDYVAKYWASGDGLDEGEAFLRNYILNEEWKDKDKAVNPTYDEIINELDEDDKEIESQDIFEKSYNFRFEEPNANEVISHPREVESIRRKSDSRKKQREQRNERKRLERLQKEEELKRLKNLKKQEIIKKLDSIKKVSGAKELAGLTEEDLEEDFDPEAHDKKMQQLFNDSYYDDEEKDEQLFDLDEETNEYGDLLDPEVVAQESIAFKSAKKLKRERKKKNKEK